MKKLMFAAAVAAGLAAFGEGLESQNTVGYNTKALSAGKFAILAVQFETTAGSTDINGIVSGLTGVSQDTDPNFAVTAPHIQVPNSKGAYDLYYYLTDGYYATGEKDGDGEDVYAQKPGWCDPNGIIAGDDAADFDGQLIPGVAIWAKDVQNSGTIQQSGQVPSDTTVQVTAPVTFALRANAYPISFNLNDTSKVTFTGLQGVSQESDSNFAATAPHIQVPNSKGAYDLYYYLTDGYYATGEKDGDGEDVYAQKPGWCDPNGIIAGDDAADFDGNVPAGIGFWTKGVGSTFTISFHQ